jgi:hypothetical protein
MTRHWARWAQTLLYIVAWLASTALLLADLMTLRYLILDIMKWMGVVWSMISPPQDRAAGYAFAWTVEVADRAILLIFACIGVGLAVFLEHFYRRGVQNGLLMIRLVRVIPILVAVGAVAYGVQTLI